MGRFTILPVVLGLALLLGGRPVLAGYGAVAYDTEARKNGSTWDQPSQKEADQAAVRDCGSDKCKVRFPVAPKMCGALAVPDSGPAWGGSVRKTAEEASAAALKNCQKQAKAKCTIRESNCTK